MSVSSGTVLNGNDISNTVGTITNNGSINLSGDMTNAGTTNGNGIISLFGNWANTGTFTPGTSTIILNGSLNQTITKAGGEAFYNLNINNAGVSPANRIVLSDNVTVSGTLTISLGNIEAGVNKLLLSNQASASLSYTSLTGSRIIGKFERGINASSTYLFPVGTSANYNPVNLITNVVPTAGTVLSEFISGAPGDNGLPLPDGIVEVANAYTDGYWSLTANGFSSSDYSISIDGSGFLTPILDITRVIKRTAGGNWLFDGTHSNAIGSVGYRNNLTGNISSSGTEFGLGHSGPRITVQPVDKDVCENSNVSFVVNATGDAPLTYKWYKSPAIPLSNGVKYTGTTLSTLNISDVVLGDAGSYYCTVTDGEGSTAQSNPALLTVNAIPTAPSVTNGSICGAGSVTLQASGAGGSEVYKWYDGLTGGNLLQTGASTFSTPSISSTTNFYVSKYNTSTLCESTRTLVVATIKDEPLVTLGYSYQKTLTIDGSKVVGSNSNFPVLIHLIDNDLKTNARTDGFDIVFSDINYNKLDFNLESYNSATGDLLAWVRIPTISAGINTPIRMFYGNPQVTSDQSSPGTWEHGYSGVWHLGTSFLDATSNGNDGTNGGTSDITTGKIAGGKNFDATGKKYISVGTSNMSAASGSVEAWANTNSPAGPTGESYIFGHTTPPYTPTYHDRIQLYLKQNTNHLALGLGDTHDINANITPFTNGTWYHVVLNWDGLNYAVFVDGVSMATGTYTGLNSINTLADIGNTGNTSERAEGWNGFIDEVRVSSVVRTAGWIQTEYVNQTNPVGFLSGISAQIPNSVYDFKVCENSTGVVYSVQPQANHSYTWNVIGGAVVGSGNSITVNWGVAGAGSISLTIENTTTNCLSTSPVYSVVIDPSPVPVITGTSEVCPGSTGVHYSTPLISGHTYAWTITGASLYTDETTNEITVDWPNGCNTSGTVAVTETITATGCSVTTPDYLITIHDLIAPTIDTPSSDKMVECDGSGNVSAFNVWLAGQGGAVASDVCSSVTWTNNYAVGNWVMDCGNTKHVVVVFTATDDCGNASTTSATFTINDTTAPTITTAASAGTSECQGTTPNTNTDYITWLSSHGGSAASDLCGNNVTWSDNTGTAVWGGTPCARTITITFTATDDCGNASTTSATFTINDTTAPTITTAASAGTSECQGTTPNTNTDYITWLSSHGGSAASDLCGNNVTWSDNTGTAVWGGTPCARTITITFTATDDCGNASTTSATFTINDTTAPTITTAASAGTSECQGTTPNTNTDYITWLSSHGGSAASDLCGNNVTWSDNTGTAVWGGTPCARTITITFTATDDCGNASTTSATFTINDTTAPTITTAASAGTSECQGTTPNTNTDYITWLSSHGGSAASDLCGNNVTWSDNTGTAVWGGTPCARTITITFTATDDCGNASTTSATFTINDTTAPTITTAASAGTSECQGTTPNTNTDYITWLSSHGGSAASDLCGNNVTWSDNTGTAVWGGTPCARTITITFTATDDCGNASTTSATFTINDTTAPTITTAASAGTSECQGTTPNTNTDYITWLSSHGGSAASDLCGNNVTWSDNTGTAVWGGTPCARTITITFTATDDCGNASTTSATFTINDTTAPTITTAASAGTSECQGTTPNTNTDYITWLSSHGGSAASDLCGNNVTWSDNTGTAVWGGTPCARTITITFTATDDCGNASTTSATFTINDTTAPTITTAASAGTSECQGTTPNTNTDYITWLSSHGGSAASDLCGNNVTWSDNTGTAVWGGTPCARTITITFTATDDCGNASTTSATFTINDTTAPTITTAASAGTSECQGTTPNTNTDYITWLSSHGGSAASDLCGNNVTWSDNTGTAVWGGTPCARTITITFTATDDCGNASTTSATFTINDTTAPTITTAASAGTSECQGTTPNTNTDYITWLSSHGGSAASDLCGNNVTWSDNTGTAVWGGTPCARTITITFTATDDCGNASTTSATFTINDTTAPTITTAASAGTSECQGTTPNTNTDYITWLSSHGGSAASDLCGNNVTWSDNTGTAVWGGTPCARTITITFTATDDCGNASTTSATFTINDTTAPTITTAASAGTSECQGTTPNTNTDYITWLSSHGGSAASDLCGNNVTWSDNTGTAVWGGTPCARTITITFTATDDCGNASTTSATFTINDTTAPTITTAASAGTSECQGTTPNTNTDYITWLSSHGGSAASDLCGNNVTWSDNTGTAVWGGTPCARTITITFTATDDCGNASTTSATFTINDTTAPTITTAASAGTSECQGTTPNTNTDYITWLSSHGGSAASDLCGNNVTWSDNTGTAVWGGTPCARTITITFTATDDCGNASTTSATFTINDTTAPTITTAASAGTSECQGTTPNTNTDYITWLSSHGGSAASDLCGNNVTWSDNTGTAVWGGTPCARTITITFTATDDCGNASTTSATFTINDTTAPTITTAASAGTSECQGTTPNTNTDYITWLSSHGGSAASDLCGNNVTWSDNTGTAVWGGTPCARTITITFTATDDCGNASTTSATFTINDTTAPTITTAASAGTSECQGTTPNTNTDYITWLSSHGGSAASDLCGNNVTWSDNTGTAVWGGTPCARTITITFTATDDCGNASTTSATFTINDTTAPTITTAASAGTSECQGTTPNTNTDYITWLSSHGGSAASDLCGNNVTWSDNTGTAVWGGTPCARTITITFTATDDCGNASTTSATFTINDTTAPTITTAASAGTSECQGTTPNTNTDYITWLSSHGGSAASDLCGNNVTWSDNTGTAVWGGTPCARTITITFTATDDCGNASTTSATFTINDTTAPTITTAASAGTSECQGTTPNTNTDYITWLSSHGGSAASDLCGNNVTWSDNTGTAVWGGTPCARTITITFTATDDCGNASTTSATFTINDTTAPTITTAASAGTSECQGTTPNTNTDYITWLSSHGGSAASDLCGNNVTWSDNTGTAVWGGTPCARTITITFTATDDCGNASTTSATFTINDTTAPTITTAASAGTSECQGTTPNTNTDYITWLSSHGGSAASDLCGNNVTWSDNTGTAVWGGTPCARTITITFTATDDCGNASTTSATFTINDTTAPTITTAASDKTVQCDGAGNVASFNAWLTGHGGSVASDVCNSVTWSNDYVVGNWVTDCGNAKHVVVVFTATDACGNLITTSSTFKIEDTTPPTFTAPADKVICRNSDCTYDISLAKTGDVTDENDNCSTSLNATYLDDISGVGSCDQLGIILRTWSLIDKCGNAAPDQVQIIYINPRPNITVTASDAILCYTGGSVDFNVSTTNTISPLGEWRYDVEITYPANVTGTYGGPGATITLLNQTSTGLTALTDNLTNAGDIVRTVTYKFTPHILPGDGGLECQNGVVITRTVEIDPQPKIAVTTDPVLCYDGSAVFNVSTVNTAVSTGGQWRYDVEITYPANVTGTYGGPGATVTLLNQISTGLTALTDNLTNSGDVVRTVTYKFTPHIQPGDLGAECGNGVVITKTVEINPRPRITVTTDVELCYNDPAKFNITNVNTVNVGATWYYDISPVVYPAGVTGGWTLGLTDQTATGLAALTDNIVNNTNVVQTVIYTFTPHIRPGDGGSECINGVAVTVTIKINPRPRITVTTDGELCYNDPAKFNITNVNTVNAGATWYYDISPVTYPIGVTGGLWASGQTDQTATGVAALTENLVNNTNDVQTVSYTFTPHIRPGDGGSECTAGVPVTVTIKINPRPRITVTTDGELCYNDPAKFNITNVNTVNAGATWYYDISPVTYPVGVTGGLWASGQTDQTATGVAALTENLVNNTNDVQTVSYTFTPHIRPGDGGSGCTNGVPVTVTIKINPRPRTTITTDGELCYNDPAKFNITNVNTVNAGATWYYDVTPVTYPAGVTGLWASGLTDQTATGIAALTDNLVNNNNDVQTVSYTFTPHIRPGDGGSECSSGVAVTVTVKINPRPRITVTTDGELCYNDPAKVNITNVNTVNAGATWYYDVSPVVYPAGVTGGWSLGLIDQTLTGIAALTDNLVNNTNDVQTVNYTFTPHIRPGDGGSECTNGVQIVMIVRIHAKPLQSITVKPLTCDKGSDAALTAVISNGAGPYVINWTGPLFTSDLLMIDNLKKGTYYVTVKDNLNCSSNGSEIISALPASPNIEIDRIQPYPYPSYGVSCRGNSDGGITVSVAQGITAPYHFDLIKNNTEPPLYSGDLSDIKNDSDPTTFKYYPGLGAGIYTLIIHDKNGCETRYSDEIIPPPLMVATFIKSQYDGGYNISCKGYNDGSISIQSTTGGWGGYSYNWSKTDGSIPGPANLDHIDNLTAGTYTLEIKDLKGCVQPQPTTITEPGGMVLTGYQLSKSPDGNFNVSCNGGNDGTISMTIDGGSGNYDYSWTGPAGFTATTKDLTGLKAGVYSCVVHDLNGCSLTPLPVFTLTEPAPLVFTALTTSVSTDGSYNINCYGANTGWININVSGGSPGSYRYNWNTSDGSGLINGNKDQNSLSAGTYHLSVTDANNCALTKDITLSQPSVLVSTLTASNITCKSPGFNNGSIILTMSGGVEPYSYLWSNGATTKDISGLTQGNYNVTVTDVNGCILNNSAIIELPPPLSYTKNVPEFNGYNISCNGLSDGSINVDLTSGAPPYNYTWTGPNGFTGTTKSISGLKAGQYHMLIVDSNECRASEVFDLTEPGILDMNFTLSSSTAGGYNVNCAGDNTGSIDVVAVNQVKNVEYLWADGIFGKTRTNLPAGNYDIIITDANNCHASATVTLTQPDSLKNIFNVIEPFCPDKPDGSITANVTGGVKGSDYYYRWTDNSTNKSLLNIPEGNYKLTITDLNGCSIRDSVMVNAQNETCLVIPNAISPNGDLINDVWNIGLKELYPNMEVKIINRWGESIWNSARGYPQPWDGTSNGRSLPIDSYIYIIDLHNGTKPIVGNITIVR